MVVEIKLIFDSFVCKLVGNAECMSIFFIYLQLL
jgi:hypothetical protein